MNAEELLRQLEQGATLEGPHWTEPVKVLTAKARGTKIEVQAVGLRTKRLWTKLLKAEEFGAAVKITQAGQLAALDGNPFLRFLDDHGQYRARLGLVAGDDVVLDFYKGEHVMWLGPLAGSPPSLAFTRDGKVIWKAQ